MLLLGLPQVPPAFDQDGDEIAQYRGAIREHPPEIIRLQHVQANISQGTSAHRVRLPRKQKLVSPEVPCYQVLHENVLLAHPARPLDLALDNDVETVRGISRLLHVIARL